ncbi:hypothetical protein [Nocardioides sp. GXZ039]|uniref:hypothetical protein n=1 Tax=Nocardioides sp. GXZ039 TaxID=3136018 RepID=UPI0030F47021
MTPPSPLAGFEVCPGPLQLFAFSAATGNPHRIHYDRDYATAVEGLPGLLVQGPLLGTWMLELLDRWAQPSGSVESFTYRSIRPVTEGAVLHVGGGVEPSASEPGIAVLETWVRTSDGETVATGRGRVATRTESA